MPTYEYECEACGHKFEKFQPITSKAIKKCPVCGKNKVKRLIGIGAGMIFKGSGFYITDYRDSSYSEKAKADTAPAASSTESKPETKTETKPDSKPSTGESCACGKIGRIQARRRIPQIRTQGVALRPKGQIREREARLQYSPTHGYFSSRMTAALRPT